MCAVLEKDLGHSTALVMIEKPGEIWDNIGVFAAVFSDLSKAFDCISHELLIAKLSAYGFDTKSLNFILVFSLIRNKNKGRLQLQWPSKHYFHHLAWFAYGTWCNRIYQLRRRYHHLYLWTKLRWNNCRT